jgi:hypothetical protein
LARGIEGEVVIEQAVSLVVNESNWLSVSMGLATLVVTMLLYAYRNTDLPVRRRVLAAMNLLFGVTIGTMAFGHLLAITVKLALGTLDGPIPLFYVIGAALAVPSWWLLFHTRAILASERPGQATLVLNAWLAITLLSLGIHNLPLAAAGLLNIAYHMHSRPAVGWAIVGVAIVVTLGLFVGSLIFMASGQSFEQFAGTD